MNAPDSRLIFPELSVEFHSRLVGYLKSAPVAAAQDAHR